MVGRLSSAFVCAAMALSFGLAAGCETAPKSRAGKQNLVDEARTKLKTMQRTHPELREQIRNAYGYAIFPNVGEGGAIVAGAYGRGAVFERASGDNPDRLVGFSSLTEISAGAQAGGQNYTELILFENKDALDRFRAGNFEFAADASAVALKAGVSKTANFDQGVAVYTQPLGGLWFEAAIGGQKFNFRPADQSDLRQGQGGAANRPGGQG